MRVISFNLWGVPSATRTRFGHTCRYLLGLEPTLVGLQEVATPHQQFIVEEAFRDTHHVVRSRHIPTTFPWVAYLPAAVIALVLWLWAASSPAWLSLFFMLPAVWTWWAGVDHMALATLVCRREFDIATLVVSQPFQRKGYTLQDLGLWLWWFSHCFLNPGFTIVRCRRRGQGRMEDFRGFVFVVNLHLTPGDTADYERSQQLQEVITTVDRLRKRNPSSQFLICGDFNVSPESFVVCSLFSREWRHVSAGVGPTWDPKRNPLAKKGTSEEIDHIWAACNTDLGQPEATLLNKVVSSSDHFGVQVDFSPQCVSQETTV